MNDDRDQSPGSNDWSAPQGLSQSTGGTSDAPSSPTAEEGWQKGDVADEERAHRERLAKNRESRIKRIQKTEMRHNLREVERRGGRDRYVRSRNVEHVSGGADASFAMLVVGIVALIAIVHVVFNTDLLDDLMAEQSAEVGQEMIVAPAEPGQGQENSNEQPPQRPERY
jgi:hypothetical protein